MLKILSLKKHKKLHPIFKNNTKQIQKAVTIVTAFFDKMVEYLNAHSFEAYLLIIFVVIIFS